MVLDLNPLAVVLVDRIVQSEDDAKRAFETIDAAVVEAIDQYVMALLSGDASGGEDVQFTVNLRTSPAVNQVLVDAIAGDEQFESTAKLVAQGVASVLGGESSVAWELCGPDECRRHLNAVVRNGAYGFDDREAFVEAAIAWFLRERCGSECTPNSGETHAE